MCTLHFRWVSLLLPPLAAHWGSALPGWGGPITPLPARGLRALLGGGSLLVLLPAAAHLGRALLCLGIPLRPLAACRRPALPGEWYPPPSPPWWLHVLSMRDRSGGLRSLSLSSYIQRARSARCLVLSLVSVSVRSWLTVPLVALWPDPLTRGPALARPPSISSDFSMPYLWHKCMPFLGLAPSEFHSWGPVLSSSAAVPRCGRGGGTVLSPRIMFLLLPPAPFSLVPRVVRGVPSLPCPRPSSQGTPSPSVATPDFWPPGATCPLWGCK